MLESTTGRNAYYGMYSELQVKLTSLHIKLILNSSNEISLLRYKNIRLTKVHVKSYTSKTVNGIQIEIVIGRIP